MNLPRRRALLGAFASASLAAPARPAGAIVILESTWRADGFKAHIALAHQPQFAALIAFSEDEGEEWDAASGTWIGNFGGVGWVLTAAHVFKRGEPADHYLYRSRNGIIRRGTRLASHPLYNGDGNNRSGYDVALVGLDGPVGDAGQPPLLYAGGLEEDAPVVIVGFGARGTGAQGEQGRFDTPAHNKTAAENVIDEVMDPVLPLPHDDDAGNWLSVALRKEVEGAGRLDGILGGGDSGGSVWMRRGGSWYLIGVNATGTGDKYGDHSYFARLFGVRAWLAGALPGLRFTV